MAMDVVAGALIKSLQRIGEKTAAEAQEKQRARK
jgi:hypothetical protein